jgi:hypothetical protein
MPRAPSPLRQFLDELRPFLSVFPISVFSERLRADQLTPDQIIHAYQTYRATMSLADPDALWKALDALCLGTAPWFDGLDAAIKEADRLLDKERARIAVMPVPEAAFDGLNRNIKSDWTVKHYGERRLGAKYRDAAGGVLFCGVTFEREGEYSDHFYFFAEDGLWHEGVPMSTARPLYRLPELQGSAPVVVVVSGRAAAEDVPGYVVVTFAGGSSTCTDWAPLAERAVTIWPVTVGDMRAAGAIKKRLPHARVLDSERAPWEVPEAERAAYVATCSLLSMPGDDGAVIPFSFMGFDQGRYHFLPRRRRVPYTIDMGHFSSSQLLELAALGWWALNNFVKENGALRLNEAQDWIVAEQEKVGMVDLRRLRGAGVWRDGEDIVVNDGAQIVTMAGERLEYDEFNSTAGAEYIPSETRFGDMTGEESTDAEGAALYELFGSLKFLRTLDPVAALGWALIAPFGGLLKWRPHLWITGRKSTGKSTVLIEKMIDPILGEFAFIGSGRSSEPSIRRGMNLTACPGRFDEFDPGPRQPKSDLERMGKVIVLARNSSCDSTARTTLASGDTGNVTFIVRSCFLFASINLLEMDSAIESRVVRVEKLALSKDEIAEELERVGKECARVMADPSRYRRRIFRALPRILADIDAVHPLLMSFVSDARQCDVIAPLLCAAWAVQSGETIMSDSGRAWIAGLLDDLIRAREAHVEDEDRVIEHILEAQVRSDDMKTRTVAELLGTADSMDGGYAEARALLERHGLKIANIKNGDGQAHTYLAIPQRSDSIAEMLSGTPYETGYDQQLQRHVLCAGGEARVVRMAGKNTRCRCLDWAEFRRLYLGETQGRLGMEGGE